VIGNIGNTDPYVLLDKCPCLTATGSGDLRYWSFKRNRCLSVSEMMQLQGVSTTHFPAWESVVTPRAMGTMIGNAMSVGYVRRLVRQMTDALGHTV